MYCNWPQSSDCTLYHYDRHITITMTGLYANLVICDRLHALTLIACLLLWQLSSTFIHVVTMYFTVQLFILLFSFFYLQLLLLLIMHIVSSARAVSPLHTHSLWSRSDDPGFARPVIGRLFLMCRFSMRWYALRGAWVLSLWFWYTCILFLLWFFVPIYYLWLLFSCLFLSCYSLLSCVVLYVLLQWSLIIIVLIIACSGYNLGLARIRGVFSSRICVAITSPYP